MTSSPDRAASRAEVDRLVEPLFRRASARLVAALVRALGPGQLALAEEAVQEALLRALQTWPHGGVPADPEGWLVRVAKNAALDRVRREQRFAERAPHVVRAVEDALAATAEREDDALRLVFLCCHPALSPDARVALTLKNVAGFGVGEIARAFLAREDAIAQRLVRARRTLAELEPAFLLDAGDIAERLPSVHEVLYLIFNEGYAAHAGSNLVREDLVREALRLGAVLAAHPAGDVPATHALVALMALQAARIPARVDKAGELVRLEDQDRTRWDPALVRLGHAALEASASGSVETVYHLQAAIAGVHAAAPDDARTDWARILMLYDRLLALAPTPIVALNRAVALARVDGPAAGLAEVEALAASPPGKLERYYLLPATRADLLERLGRRDEARAAYREALACPCSEPERRHLERRSSACE